MSDPQKLVDMLRTVSALLLTARKTMLDSGHLDAVTEIDTLIAVAKVETDRRIAVSVAQRPR